MWQHLQLERICFSKAPQTCIYHDCLIYARVMSNLYHTLGLKDSLPTQTLQIL